MDGVKIDDVILWGRKKQRARVTKTDGVRIYQMEMPPGSGMIYMPLVHEGKNAEEWQHDFQMDVSILLKE